MCLETPHPSRRCRATFSHWRRLRDTGRRGQRGVAYAMNAATVSCQNASVTVPQRDREWEEKTFLKKVFSLGAPAIKQVPQGIF